MSYHIKVRISMLPPHEYYSHLIDEFKDNNDWADSKLESDGSWGNSEGSWYDHREDLEKFSKKHPEVTFFMEIEGEENGDMRRLYVKNGLSVQYKPKLVWPEYKESDLE